MNNPLLEAMLARVGRDPSDFRPGSKLAGVFQRNGVRDTPELSRVLALPSRDPVWSEEAADLLTEAWRTPGGAMRLRPIQASALVELHDYGGLLAPIRVGGGKTLVSLLAARAVDRARPLLILPAKLRDGKTRRDLDQLRPHWLFPEPMLISFETLGRADHAEDLEELAPDLIVVDEGHRLKNPKAAVTKRLRWYLKKHPGCLFAVLSGTLVRHSIMDFAHLSTWALRDLSPLPRPWPDVWDWARAMDPDVEELERLAPGALERLMDAEELADPDRTAAARRAFRRRLVRSPGVVSSPEGEGCAASIRLRRVRPARDPKVQAALRRLYEDWETPGGETLCEASQVWAKARQLTLGFYYRWKEKPPKAWRDARRAWYSYVRDVLARSRTLASELEVARAHADADERRAWVKVRDTFQPETVAEWISDVGVDLVSGWLAQGPGLCWVEHVEFGLEVARRTGLPYHRTKAKDQNGRHVEDAVGPILVSIATCSEGMNLQHRWSRNLVTAPPSLAAEWEQLIGRTHREGQQADEVLVEVVDEHGALDRALQKAIFTRDATGAEQKLLMADIEEG